MLRSSSLLRSIVRMRLGDQRVYEHPKVTVSEVYKIHLVLVAPSDQRAQVLRPGRKRTPVVQSGPALLVPLQKVKVHRPADGSIWPEHLWHIVRRVSLHTS